MDLTHCLPSLDLASTGYCLAHPGHEYVAYLPEGGVVKLDLTAGSGQLAVEWFNPNTGETTPSRAVEGGDVRELITPFAGEGVVYVVRRGWGTRE